MYLSNRLTRFNAKTRIAMRLQEHGLQPYLKFLVGDGAVTARAGDGLAAVAGVVGALLGCNDFMYATNCTN